MKAKGFRAITSILVALVMLAGVCMVSGTVLADEVVKVVEKDKIKVVVFKIGDYHYYLEDIDGSVSKTKMDAAPYIKQGRTFVPVRYLSNALGLTDNKINWDGAKREVRLDGNKVVHMQIGNKTMYSDLKPIIMDVVPEIIPPGRTMLLARYVAEGLGFKVDWDQSRQLVICYPEEKAKPDLEKIIEEIEGKKPVEEPPKPGTVEERYQAIKDSDKGFISEDQLDKEMCDYVWNVVIPHGEDDRIKISDEKWEISKPLVSNINKLRECFQDCPYPITSVAPSRFLVRATSDPENSWYCYAFVNGRQLAVAEIWYDQGYQIRWITITTEDIFEGKWGEPTWLR
jgi:hypothetical protein